MPADREQVEHWDTAHEWRAILLLALGFGLVGLDRFLILPLFPVIMQDLHLNYADIGNITGALAITWGISAFVVGKMADRFRRKVVLVSAMIAFSLLVGFSGLATGALSLILIRAMMGAAEGAYPPPSLVATFEVSRPDRLGLNLGLQQMAAPLLGLAIAPILVTQLIHYIDWRYIFLIAAPPGLVIAGLLWRTIREPVTLTPSEPTQLVGAGAMLNLLPYRNVWLAALCMMTWLNALIVLTAFLPSYLVDHLKLPLATMGYVMSAVGFGAVIGSVAIPAVSDRIGRKTAALLAVVGAAAALSMLSNTGPDSTMLFVWLMTTSIFLYGAISLTVGPLSIEAIPVHLRATASGTVIAVGELFGGGIAPVLAGNIAHKYGITSIFDLAIGGFIVGLIACLLLNETAPSRIGPKRVA